jgi:Mg-chelatase subunit ChlD
MSVALSASLTKSLSLLSATEAPRLAVRILPSAAATTRRSFHLALLLDVSGSMDGERITALQTTLRLLIDSLADDDVLTLIKYHSTAYIVAEATRINAEARLSLRDEVDRLQANGGTNMEGAIAALRQVSEKATNPTIDAVFLLTDGHINQGLVSAAGLIRLLSASVPTGTPVHTLGYGAEHNSRMLRDMSMRTRGSYMYADANEVLPAVIGDIMAGMATEVGRNGTLTLPDGWKCLELAAAAEDRTFHCGTLIAEKPQWIMLEGPVGCAELPAITFTYTTGADATVCSAELPTSLLDSYHAEEQFCRCRTATVQSRVQELLESGNLTEAQEALRALGAELDANAEKDRTFIISLRAQVDEMLDAISSVSTTPAFGFGLHRQRAVLGAGPALAPVLSRMASNTAALGNQRGFVSALRSNEMPSHAPALRSSLAGVSHAFSSPAQATRTATMTQRYSEVSAGAEGSAVVSATVGTTVEETNAFLAAIQANHDTSAPPTLPPGPPSSSL